jgi:hypothetical protein
MKQLTLIFVLLFLFICVYPNPHKPVHTVHAKGISPTLPFFLKDTCIIEGLTFKMLDYKSTKKLKAYIKNGQIYVVNQGLQYTKYRVTYYIFSSMDDEQMPAIRHFNQRLSPPVLGVLKNARVGNQFLFEEIIVVDPSNIELTNAVRPILIERIKN